MRRRRKVHALQRKRWADRCILGVCATACRAGGERYRVVVSAQPGVAFVTGCGRIAGAGARAEPVTALGAPLPNRVKLGRAGVLGCRPGFGNREDMWRVG